MNGSKVRGPKVQKDPLFGKLSLSFYGSRDIGFNIFKILKASVIQKCFDLESILNQTKSILILKKLNFIAHINFNESLLFHFF